jgi:glycosyltransferase involved in cell wall biosynthesis
MFSILIPIYNGIEFLEESLQSVLNQTNDQWEVLIGINGHSPESEVLKKAFKYSTNKVTVYDFPKEEIKGKSQALNALVKYAKYDYIAVLDVDDIWHPTKLDVQLEFIKRGYDIVGSRCIYFGDRLNGIIPEIPTGDLFPFNFFQSNPVINSSAIIKREYAYWDSSFDGVEDYELWLRLWLDKHSFYNCSQILVKHRLHAESAYNAKGNANLLPRLLQKYKIK